VGILETPGSEEVNYVMLLYLTLMHFLSVTVRWIPRTLSSCITWYIVNSTATLNNASDYWATIGLYQVD